MNRLLTLMPLAFWRNLASVGLIGLILWVILWNGWLTPYQRVPRLLELLLLLTSYYRCCVACYTVALNLYSIHR